MICYQPETPTYRWDGNRQDLALEYRRMIRGPFGLEVQKILDRMRSTPLRGRLILLVLEPFQLWGLARLSGERGVPPVRVEGVTYASMAEAEWDIFKRRWEDLTGVPVTVGEESAR